MPPSKFMMKFKKSKKTLLLGILLAGLSMTAPFSRAETYQVVYHLVEENETLLGLSQKFDIPVADIQKVNGKNNTNIKVGERLLIPITKVVVNTNKTKVKKSTKKLNKITAHKPKKRSKPSKNIFKHIETQKHRVQISDTLGAIALQYGTTVADITKTNNITEDYILMIDDLLLIPSKGKTSEQQKTVTNSQKSNANKPSKANPKAETSDKVDVPLVYKVLSGDTLGIIADKYKLKLSDIIELNTLEDVDTLHVGQKLTLRKEVCPSKDYTKISQSNTY